MWLEPCVSGPESVTLPYLHFHGQLRRREFFSHSPQSDASSGEDFLDSAQEPPPEAPQHVDEASQDNEAPPAAPKAVAKAKTCGRPPKRPASPTPKQKALSKALQSNLGKLAEEVWGAGPFASKSNVTQALLTGGGANHIKEKLQALAWRAWEILRRDNDLRVQRVLALSKLSAGRVQVQPLFFMRWRSYDGTKARIRVQTDVKVPTLPLLEAEKESGPHEIFVVQAGWAAALRLCSSITDRARVSAAEHGNIVILSSEIPTRLQSIDSPAAECVQEALKQLNSPLDAEVAQRFLRRVDIVNCDGHRGNLRCERFRAAERDSLVVLCEAHRKANALKPPLAVLDPFSTNIIRVGLALRGTNLTNFKRAIREVLAEQLVVYRLGAPSAECAEHRRCVMNMFLSGKSADSQRRRHIINNLWNGDWKRVGVIEHHCVGCCANRKHTLRQMVTTGIRALCPKGIGILMRSNWTGAEHAVDSVGLLYAMHGLFAAAFCRAFPAQQERKRLPGVAGAPAAAPLLALANEALSDEEDPAAGGSACDGARAEREQQSSGPSVWKEDDDRRINSARAWLVSDACWGELVIARVQLRVGMRYLKGQLTMGGLPWEHRQQLQLIQEGKRSYQLWELYDDELSVRLSEDVSELIFSSAGWSLTSKTEHVQKESFKVLGKLGAAALEERERHRWWPFKTFQTLRDQDIMDAFENESACLLGQWSKNLREFYQAANNFAGGAMAAELMTTLQMSRADTVACEREHTMNERRICNRRHTAAQDLETLSAIRLGRKFHETPAGDVATFADGEFDNAGDSRHQKRRCKSERKKKKPRGGWAWKVFCNMHLDGRKLTLGVAAELSEWYAGLDEVQLALYKRLGEEAEQRWLAGLPAVIKSGVKRGRQRMTELRANRVALPAADPDAELPLAALPAEEAPRSLADGAVLQKSVIESNADDVHEAAAAEVRRQEAEYDSVRRRLAEYGAHHSASVQQQFALVDDSTRRCVQSLVAEPRGVRCLSAQCMQNSIVPALVLRGEGLGNIEADAERWNKMHNKILKKDCDALGKVPTTASRCHLARRCLHKLDNAAINLLILKFRGALALFIKDDKVKKKLVANGDVVICLHWDQVVEAPVVHPEHGEAPDPSDLAIAPAPPEPTRMATWLHLSHDRGGDEWRDTFLRLERRPEGDRGDTLGVQVSFDGRNQAGFATMWQVFEELSNRRPITIQWYVLHSDDLPVARILPRYQRVRACGEPSQFWNGLEAELASAKRYFICEP